MACWTSLRYGLDRSRKGMEYRILQDSVCGFYGDGSNEDLDGLAAGL